jgi:phage terminase large subunit
MNDELNIDLKISQERLEELQKTHKITKVSPTQARDIEAILSNRHPLILVEGGRDGGKSVSLYLAIAEILSGGLGSWKANILLMRNTKESARKSIFDGVLKSVLEHLEINYDDLKQKSYDRGRVTINGHQIRIDSFDVDSNNQDRLKGYKDITHVFIEELAEVTQWGMFNQLFQTIPRNFDVFWEENGVKKSKNWRGQIVCTFNTPQFGSPIINDFYDLEPSEYDGFYKTKPKSGVILEKDYNTGELIPHPKGLTYEQMKWHYSFSTVYDNTVLKEKLMKQGGEQAWDLYLYQQHERFKTTDPYYYFTATLGLVGTGRSGKIFNGWQEITEEEYKKVEATEFYGIDWGFSGQGDPSALTAVKHIPAENVGELPSIYINNLLYEKGLTLPKLVEKIMQSVPNFANAEFYIDHMPAAQSELVDKGFNRNYVILADKGADSRAISASYIAGNFKIYYVKNKTLDKELENYQWVIDRQGNPTGKPSDGGDHIIDSIRYPIYTKLHPKKNETSKFWDDFYADYLLTDGEKTSTF